MKPTEMMKVSECDCESEAVERWLINLERRIKALEEEILVLQRGDNTGLKHINDGGWFD